MEPYDLVTAAAARLTRSQLEADGNGGVLWLEQRPDLEGRTILCSRSKAGLVTQLGDPSWSLASSIGGYGGRAYVVAPHGIYVVLARSHELWFLPEVGEPRLYFSPPPTWALGDLVLTNRGVTAIREIAGDSIARSIVAIDESGEVVTLFEGPHFLMDLRAAPLGNRVAFVHWEHPDMPWDAAQVTVAAVSPEGPLGVEQHFGGRTSPSWAPRFSPDGVFSFQQTIGEWITPTLVSSQGELASFGGSHDYADVPWTSTAGAHLVRANGELLGVARRDGSHVLQLLTQGSRFVDGDAVTIVDLCESDGSVLVLAATHAERTTLFCLDEVTESLRPLLPSTPRSVTPLISTAISGPHGERIEGFFASPEGAVKPPLIVFCHGGPTAQVDPSFDPAVQVFCSRGFAVAAPNYRGSTGFGLSYRTALNGNWGIVDVADVIAYARGLIELGLVDAQAVFIRGGSAGGFTALRALSSGQFLGATGNYACTDLVQLAHMTHDFELHYLDSLLGPLATNESAYADRSPINHPEELKGSVLLLQGSEDVVVPASQTEQLVDRCRALGLDVTARFFAEEGHGFRRASTLVAAFEVELAHYARLLAELDRSR